LRPNRVVAGGLDPAGRVVLRSVPGARCVPGRQPSSRHMRWSRASCARSSRSGPGPFTHRLRSR